MTAGGAAAALGLDLLDYPLVAERLAIDITGALRGASAGVRALRGRPLLRRLLDLATGAEPELQAAVAADLTAAQRGALRLVREIMREESRTQACVTRVLVNLQALGQEVEALMGTSARLSAEMTELRGELLGALRQECARLSAEISGTRREVRREAVVRRLTERFRAGSLHPRVGPVLEATLFLAEVAERHQDAEPGWRRQELETALAVVRQRLAPDPVRLEEALLRAVEPLAPDNALPVLYLAERADGHGVWLAVVGALGERRAAGLPTGEANAREVLAIARALRDPEGQLAGGLITLWELARALADELSPPPAGPAP